LTQQAVDVGACVRLCHLDQPLHGGGASVETAFQVATLADQLLNEGDLARGGQRLLFLACRIAVRLAVELLDLALVVGEELCLIAAIPGASVDLAVAPHAEVKRGALLGDLLRGHASVDEVLDCLVVCVLCHFSSLSRCLYSVYVM